MKDKVKDIVKIVVCICLFFMFRSIMSDGVKVIEGIVRGVHGAPSFVTPALGVFSNIMKILLITAYMIIGIWIPIKNKVLKGLTFILLYWSSAYLCQVLGMTGAASGVVDPEVSSVMTIVFDSAGYLISGLLIGVLLTFHNHYEKKACKKGQLLIASIVSAIVFPSVMFVLERLLGLMNPGFLCVSSFAIAKEDIWRFYVVFYLFQAVSGLIMAIFYRYSEFNSTHKRKWLIFASVYGWMLWTPIVLIMYFFGIALWPTIAFAVIMLIAIYIDTFIFDQVLRRR